MSVGLKFSYSTIFETYKFYFCRCILDDFELEMAESDDFVQFRKALILV